MNTNKTKNVLFIVLIAVVSSVVTLFGYNVINRNSVASTSGNTVTSEEIGAYSATFDQNKNVVLTNLTTS
ncbi:MAG: deoxyribonuclease HsdR, partial [Fermentimonas sp.]|nr:deoxyribonuclease HsdR [Fermentimonas sp.]